MTMIEYGLVEPADATISYTEMVEWIAALRSGSYEQGQRRLRSYTQDGSPLYCCLGVLEVLSPDNLDPYAEEKLMSQNDERSAKLPDFTQGYLAVMNDLRGFSFSQIADWIEANLLPWAALAENFRYLTPEEFDRISGTGTVTLPEGEAPEWMRVCEIHRHCKKH